jgi:hypothetical protein
MRKLILDNIKTGLLTNIGVDSSVYQDLKVEDILSYLPEMVTVNYFVGILVDKAKTGTQEIGRYDPTIKIYNCMIVVLIKNLDTDSGQDELDTIVNRITKYLAKDNGNLAGLKKTKDGIVEYVVTYGIQDFNYVSRALEAGEMGHICGITLSIRTELKI